MYLIRSEIVKVYDLLPIRIGDSEILFRLEIHRDYQDSTRYFPRLLEFEYHRITPSFPQREDGTPKHEQDAVILLCDELVDMSDCGDDDIDGCLQKVDLKIRQYFALDS